MSGNGPGRGPGNPASASRHWAGVKRLLVPAALSLALLVPLPAAASGPSPSPSPTSGGGTSSPSPTSGGGTSSPSSTPTPPPCLAYAQPTSAPGSDRTYLSRRSAGASLTVAPGAELLVQFDCGDDRVSLPTSASLAVVRTGGSLQPSGRGGEASFDAVQPGTAVLSATFTPECPGGPCGRPSLEWRVTVTVREPVQQPCLAVASGGASDVTARAGIPVPLAFTTRSATATVALVRTDPAPVAQVRRQPVVRQQVQFEVAPTVTTVLEARTQDAGCPPVVRRVLVAPLVSLAARRTAVRTHAFTGRVFPARGQVVNLFREATGTAQPPVLTAQTRVRADGTYRIDRPFLGTGRFLFSVRTSAVPSNVAGSSVGVVAEVR